MGGAPFMRRDLESRYECKYLLPEALMREVRMRIAAFVEPDAHARGRPGNRYPVGSLYLDSPDLRLHRMTEEGHRDRFKLRLRAYDDEAASPVFFEVKRRQDDVIRKWRRAARRAVAGRFLARRPLALDPRDPAPDLGEFLRRARPLDAGPVLRVRYQREAYEARGGEPTRITFDTELEYKVTFDGDLSLDGSGWKRAMTDTAVLEIKFTERFPTWVQDVVRSLDLRRVSVPKYCLSMNLAISRGHCALPMIGHRSVTART